MNSETGSIPNIQVENIGSRKKPHYAIRGFVELPCWNGYYLYDDSYKLKKDKVVTNGRVELWVDGEIRPDFTKYIPSEQANAYFYLTEQQESIKHSILDSLRQEFPRLLSEEYPYSDLEEGGFPALADLTPDFDFRNYIGPESISIGEDVKDGIAYIQWYFRCQWDPEHGFQVITHNERVIDIAPEADPWKIYKDNGTFEQVQKEYDSRAPQSPKKQKKWWQLW